MTAKYQYEFIQPITVGFVLGIAESIVGLILGVILAGILGASFSLANADLMKLTAAGLVGILTLVFALWVKGHLATWTVTQFAKK